MRAFSHSTRTFDNRSRQTFAWDTVAGCWGTWRSSRNDACVKKSIAAVCASLRSIGGDRESCIFKPLSDLRTREIGVSVACQDELISGGDFLEAGTQLCVGQFHLVPHFLPLETGQ